MRSDILDSREFNLLQSFAKCSVQSIFLYTSSVMTLGAQRIDKHGDLTKLNQIFNRFQSRRVALNGEIVNW